MPDFGQVMQKLLNFFRANLMSLAIMAFVLGWIGYQRLEAWLSYKDLIGTPAPGFSLADASGRLVNVPQLTQGKKTLLVFWATWCGVCRSEIDTLREAQEKLAGKNFALISVVLPQNETLKDINDFISEKKINYPVLIGDGQVSNFYKVKALPTNVWIDADGKIEDLSIGRSFGLLGKLEDWTRADN